MPKRILIIGVGGQVGEKLAGISLAHGLEVYGTYKGRRTNLPLNSQYELDKTNSSTIEHVFTSVRPDIVVDTGAIHNVDYCETKPEEAHAVN